MILLIFSENHKQHELDLFMSYSYSTPHINGLSWLIISRWAYHEYATGYHLFTSMIPPNHIEDLRDDTGSSRNDTNFIQDGVEAQSFSSVRNGAGKCIMDPEKAPQFEKNKLNLEVWKSESDTHQNPRPRSSWSCYAKKGHSIRSPARMSLTRKCSANGSANDWTTLQMSSIVRRFRQPSWKRSWPRRKSATRRSSGKWAQDPQQSKRILARLTDKIWFVDQALGTSTWMPNWATRRCHLPAIDCLDRIGMHASASLAPPNQYAIIEAGWAYVLNEKQF